MFGKKKPAASSTPRVTEQTRRDERAHCTRRGHTWSGRYLGKRGTEWVCARCDHSVLAPGDHPVSRGIR